MKKFEVKVLDSILFITTTYVIEALSEADAIKKLKSLSNEILDVKEISNTL